jgi:hypothetical protein
VPEIIDPVFAKTSQNARFLLSENDRFGLVFVKTGSINSSTGGKTLALQRHYTENSKQIFPEMKLRGLDPNSYIYVSVSDIYIYMIGLLVMLQIVGINT